MSLLNPGVGATPNTNQPIVTGQTAEVTSPWTSSTVQNTTVQLNVTNYPSVTVFLNQGSTITGGIVTFEASDTVIGTNWYPITMVPTSSGTIAPTYTLVANTNVAYQMNVSGFILFRVRLSTVIAGTGTVNIGITASAGSTEWQQSLTDGTNTANIVSQDAGLNSLATGYATKSVSFTTNATGIIGPYNCSGYSWVAIQLTSVGTGATVSGQFLIDTNWIGTNSWINSQSAVTAVAGGPTVNTTSISEALITGTQFRLNLSVLSSGTFSGTIVFMTTPRPMRTMGVSAVGTRSNNTAIPGAVNFGSLVAVANATVPTYIEGNEVLLSSDLSGNARFLLNGGLMPTNTALNTYSVHITTNTTTTPTSSTAYISNITISIPTLGTTSTITIKDKQGTALTLINSLSTAAALTNGNIIYDYQVPAKMVSGIDIVTAGSVAATVDVWIGYYQ